MKIEDCFYLGKILKPFSYKGEVVLFLDVDEPMDYSELDGVYVSINKKLVLYTIKSIRINNNKAIVRFDGVEYEDLERLLGRELYLPLELLPPLEGNKFYFHEIIGFSVIDTEKGDIGKIIGVYENAPQPLLSIDCEGKEILLPIIDEVILEVLRQEKQMKVQSPEGLIELYLQ
ncbi:MAG: 16S rRNA processing protein RimM [Bacteroidales bacterium]|jgi:16S rRNA processing protein RimM|nr:16S rRNA processing protein RimM [Bacteroidales bacterium]